MKLKINFLCGWGKISYDYKGMKSSEVCVCVCECGVCVW